MGSSNAIQVGDKVYYNIGLGRGVAQVKEVRQDGMATLKTKNGRFVERKVDQLERIPDAD